MDLISNMISSIKNASMAGKSSLEVPYTKQAESICKVIKQANLLKEVKSFKKADSTHKGLHIDLNAERLSEIKRISTPGKRVYESADNLGRFLKRGGVAVISTSRGIMSAQEAKKKKLGGEVICIAY